ncbi:MAG TPA: alanine--tRNA ligase, partial [Chitinophagaceae bacterium]|nr:alanine--tRNA ligase [Chitinophagaceae bacterium]
NRLKDGRLEPLPARHVDTGMGLERLVRVLQGKTSNYDTDLFTGTIREVETITGKSYQFGDSKQDIAFRVLADHIRAISFTIADGQLPSNTGAGYVIRRILRRAVRYYYSFLDYRQPLLFQLVSGLAARFAGVFGELQAQEDFVRKVIREEEEAFLRTLEKGIAKFNELVGSGRGPDRDSRVLDGAAAFLLYDTYGFPIDLTCLMAREIGWEVDMDRFTQELQKQKDRSRAATAVDTQDWVILDEQTGSRFVGYDRLEDTTRLVRYRRVKAKGREGYQLVLATTPFYAESGGQVGDTGQLLFGQQALEVTDTKKENDLIIHYTDRLPDHPEVPVIARVDGGRRQATALHHSATHLLHAALRRVLGTHVAQKGSLVTKDHLRFDFSHFARLQPEELLRVEELVNEKIRANLPVVIREMPREEALRLGAMALFGEKYGDTVRVVTMDPDYSIELCGGTHAGSTGALGFFKITGESAVAAGVRRIEAVCGRAAEAYVHEQLDQLARIREALKNPADPLRTIGSLQAENAEQARRLEHLENRLLVGVRNELLTRDEIINGLTFVGALVEVPHPEALKKLCADLKNHLHDHVIVLCANIGGKPSVAIGIAETVVAARGLDAGRIIKQTVAPLIRGGGGGQKTLATAGGQEAGRLEEVIAAVRGMLASEAVL